MDVGPASTERSPEGPAMRRLKLVVGLAVVAVMGGVTAVGTVEVVRGFREDARRRQCANHLRQLGLGLHNYHEVFGAFPPGTLPNPALPPERRLSWIVVGWSSGIGDGQIRPNIDRTRPWDDPLNRPPTGYSGNDRPAAMSEMVFPACPSGPDAGPGGDGSLLDHVGIAGVGLDAPALPKGHPRAGVFGYDRVTTLAEIIDGTSGTMMVVETARDNGPWTAGGPSSVRGLDPARTPYVGKGRQFGGLHAGGCNVLFADGSVHFVREPVDTRMFERLATIAGGETGDHENP